MTSFDKRPITKVIVIGAGFSGLAMACQLQRKLNCDDFTIYDRSPAPGGCAVDIPAVFYSLSFASNPNFSKVFPSQAEILDYFNNVAERFDVTRHVVPNTEWEGAYWQELTSTWLVKLKDLSTGQLYYQECKILISAVGGLVNPNQFDVPGIDDFQGDIIHTARWKTDVSLHDKDVIVVGNGYDPITALLPRSIQTKSGREYPADTIVLATGFSLTQYDVELVGRNGQTRAQHWNDFGYKEAYKSIAMSEFPNFFYVLGPNSGKGHTSTIYSIENYIDLIVQVIAPVIRDQSTFVEVKADSEKKYNETLHEAIGKTIFNNSCFSVSTHRVLV
ncbi:Baeyer-Villiger monooxygenase [Penicillium subrubescens]|uniref:Baeyer-Villiger monooxygenase n=1 Tax=Penicillium subrubescens TaxID=1316194 RepID=A0A1Q5UM56_9EURO|nr:Baeyer-Villiger monooxygenase [Penicillium subrubescens]